MTTCLAAQALGPLESAAEHDLTRTDVVRWVGAHYRAEFAAAFGAWPSDLGLALPAGAGATMTMAWGDKNWSLDLAAAK